MGMVVQWVKALGSEDYRFNIHWVLGPNVIKRLPMPLGDSSAKNNDHN